MQLTLWQIDAFTTQVFGGNYAAVIILDGWLSDELMGRIAAENNVSETAFLVQAGENDYAIRWFSPLKEIDFCGHATLAAAFVVFQLNPAWVNVVFSAPAVGRLAVHKAEQGLIEMTFPNRLPTPVDEVPPALLRALSVAPVAILKNNQAYVAVLPSVDSLRSLQVDLALVKTLAPLDLVVTAADDDPASEVDFVSRYFWPANGGDEDPVTGSIHTGLAPYWAQQLGKQVLLAKQVSARGGLLHCRVTPDHVVVAGHAVQYLRGVITL